MTAAVLGEIPLVGRVGELDLMVSRLSAAELAAFVIAGPAGVGKTRLAAEVAKAAVGAGYATAHVVATRAAASIPFGAFATLLPEISATPGGLVGLLQGAGATIIGRAGDDKRLLLVVDDAQLLDDGSAALVHQLAHTGSCSVLASLRTPGAAPDPITNLWKDGLADRLDLDPLRETDVEHLAASILGGPATGASVRWLWETSSGNPLYVRELIVGAAEAGALALDGGVWVLRLPWQAPDRLLELVAARLADLAPATVDVVDLLALGEPLGFGLLETITVPGALEDAERHGLVVVRDQGRRSETGLVHPLYAEVLRQRMPRARRRRLCALLAGALGATGARRHDDVLRVARWQLDAGVHGDPSLLGRAARRARQMYDMDLAARLARAALDSGGGAEAGLVLGEAEFFSGRHAEAEAVLAGVVPLCNNDSELALIANARSYNLGTLLGDKDAAVAVVEEALARITEPGARLRLLGRLATTRILAGELTLALADAQQLLDSGDEAMIHRGAFAASWAMALLGRTADAVTTAYLGLETQRRSTDRTQVPESQLVGATLGHAAGGRLRLAAADASTGYQVGLEMGDKDGTATFCLLRGWVNVEQGQLAAASRMFREGAAINRELKDLSTLRWCLGGVALAEGMGSNAAAAAEALAELDELPSHWMSVFDGDLIDRARAWAKVAAGEVTAARAQLREAADKAAGIEHWVTEARLLHDLARLGDPGLLAVAGRLSELASVVDGELVGTFAGHALAVLHGSGSELNASAARFEELGALLLAAEAASAAATALRSEGSVRPAAASERKAEALLRAVGGAGTPGVSHGGEVARLTRREREVAALAASGVASQEIADRLFVSIRTVHNHLQHVYMKLGVTSREELAAVLGPK